MKVAGAVVDIVLPTPGPGSGGELRADGVTGCRRGDPSIGDVTRVATLEGFEPSISTLKGNTGQYYV